MLAAVKLTQQTIARFRLGTYFIQDAAFSIGVIWGCVGWSKQLKDDQYYGQVP